MQVTSKFMIEHNFLEYFLTGFAGLFLSITSSIYFDIPAPPKVTVENVVNIITQLTILAGTLFGFYVKYKELNKFRKNRKK